MSGTSKRTFAANMLWNTVGSLTYLGCQWLITVLVARLSSSFDNAGTLSFAMSIGNLFTPFALYRMRTYQVSDVKGEHTTGEYLAFRIVTCAIAFIGCSLYAWITSPVAYMPAIVIYLLYKVVELVIDVLHGLDQKFDRLDLACVSLMLRGILSVVAFVTVLLLINSLEMALLAMVFVTAPIGFIYDRKVSSRLDSLHPHIEISTVKKLLKKCAPVVAATIACSAVITIPRQFLGSVFGSGELGAYSSIAAPVALIQMGGSYIYNPLLGRFAKVFMNGDGKGFLRLFLLVSCAMLVVFFFLSVALYAVAPAAFKILFGDKVLTYLHYLVPMLICSLLTGYLWFLGDLLLSIREFTGNFISNIAALIIAIPATYLAVPAFGANGVSYTGIISYMIAIIISVVYVCLSVKRIPSEV